MDKKEYINRILENNGIPYGFLCSKFNLALVILVNFQYTDRKFLSLILNVFTKSTKKSFKN